ncbi:MAG: acyl-[acyl-carrier-protein] thioesterase [Planctomycetota bacterium]
MNVEVREEKFRVRTFECQVDGNIKMFSLMQHLQEVAAAHAEELGFGFDRLNELNSYWVLSNLRMEISRLPNRNDEVTIRTWPSGYTRTVATREFVGKDQSGGELFRAGSEWMILNKQTNRLKNLFRLDLGLPRTGQKALPGKLSRLEPHSDYREVDCIRVPYSSIDLNGHVNNTEYVRWGIDTLRRAFEFKGGIHSIQATYLSEVFDGDELELSVSSGPNDRLSVLGRKSGTETDVFLMEVSC